MPQITLTISKNINAESIDFKALFAKIHDALKTVPEMDLRTAQSGVIQEIYSQVGIEQANATKVYLQLYWMENAQRCAMKSTLGVTLLDILEKNLLPAILAQGLSCNPRVRIAHLGDLNQSYFIL